MYLEDLIENVKNQVQEMLEGENVKFVRAENCGLDNRIPNIYVNSEECWVAIHEDYRQQLDYYGGFEYVDEDCVNVLGGYVFYEHDERIIEVIDFLAENF